MSTVWMRHPELPPEQEYEAEESQVPHLASAGWQRVPAEELAEREAQRQAALEAALEAEQPVPESPAEPADAPPQEKPAAKKSAAKKSAE